MVQIKETLFINHVGHGKRIYLDEQFMSAKDSLGREAVLHIITAGIWREGFALGSPGFGRCSPGSQCYFYLLGTETTDKNEKL